MFTVNIEVSEQRVLDVLINGLETTFWCGVRGHYSPELVTKFFDENGLLHLVDVYDQERSLVLTKRKLLDGLNLIAQNYPSDFSDIQAGNDDAETADKLLQLSLFGELKYG